MAGKPLALPSNSPNLRISTLLRICDRMVTTISPVGNADLTFHQAIDNEALMSGTRLLTIR
jgi:hypothetical protein